jgi:hypothetical protein
LCATDVKKTKTKINETKKVIDKIEKYEDDNGIEEDDDVYVKSDPDDKDFEFGKKSMTYSIIC